jgi:tetratricopeptide (TPR) repeat protein
MDRGQTPRTKSLVICALLAAITLAVFGQTLRHDFISLDDADYVYDNPVVAQGLTSHGLAWALTRFYSSNWHPLTWLSHMMDCQFYGLRPGGHHLTNVLLHAATAITLFLLLWRMTGARWRSSFVAAVFAVHPLRVESVAWVAERKDVLSGFFFMLTLWAYVRYAEARGSGVLEWWSIGKRKSEGRNPKAERNPKSEIRNPVSGSQHSSTPALHCAAGARFYALALGFFALGLMSKPMLVTTPFVLLLLDYWPLGRLAAANPKSEIQHSNTPTLQHSDPPLLRSSPTPTLQLLWEKLPFFALSLASGVVTLLAQRVAIHVGESFSLSYRLGNALESYAVYLGQLVWPAGLAVFYPFPRHGLPVPELALAGALLAGCSWVAWAQRRARPWLLFGWLWYLVMLLPVVGIIQAGVQAHADRYTYLPQVGLGVAAAWLGAQWRMKPALRGGLAAGVIAALMICAWKQTGYWQDGRTLWNHAMAVTKNNELAHYCLGHDLFQQGKVDEAASEFRQALEIRADYPDAHDGLGICLYQQGKLTEAMAQYEQALQLLPRLAVARNGLGVCLYHLGRPAEAAAQYQQALEAQPDYAEAYNNLGNSFFKMGRLTEAVAQYQKALQLQPDSAEAHNNLGLCLFQQGRLEEASAQYRAALKLRPDYVETCNNLGNVFFRLGRIDEALAQYRKAAELQPHSATAHVNVGAALCQVGRLDEAIAEFRQAVAVQPGLADAHDSLGMALLKKGNETEALAAFREEARLKPSDPRALCKVAWLLATGTQPARRDGAKALELARQANTLTGGKDPFGLETLAAALAETGRFDEAKAKAQEAIELAQAAGQTELAGQLTRELRRYESGRPLHP